MQILVLASLVAASLIMQTLSFQPNFQRYSLVSSLRRTNRRMSDSSETSGNEDDVTQLTEEQIDKQKKIFDMNRSVKFGRSKDQDGKSNIWSIEPNVEVIEDESSGASKNLIVGGLVIGASLAVLPLFNALNGLLPDPADF